MKNDSVITNISVIAILIILIFIEPWLFFWCAYLSGWIAKITIGSHLVQGLSLVGITVTEGQIPLLAGIFGWIGGFFKTINTNNNK